MINIHFSVWFAQWFRSTYKELGVNLWKYVGRNDITIQHGFNGACCGCNSLEYSNVPVPVALQPYRALADRAAAASQRS